MANRAYYNGYGKKNTSELPTIYANKIDLLNTNNALSMREGVYFTVITIHEYPLFELNVLNSWQSLEHYSKTKYYSVSNYVYRNCLLIKSISGYYRTCT